MVGMLVCCHYVGVSWANSCVGRGSGCGVAS